MLRSQESSSEEPFQDSSPPVGETTLKTACFAATAAYESQASAFETADWDSNFEDCNRDSIQSLDWQMQGGFNLQSDSPTSSANDLDLLGAIGALEVSPLQSQKVHT